MCSVIKDCFVDGWGPLAVQDMRMDGQVGRWQAGVPVMQAAFLPGHALVLAAAGGDGAVHLMDLGSQLGALP